MEQEAATGRKLVHFVRGPVMAYHNKKFPALRCADPRRRRTDPHECGHLRGVRSGCRRVHSKHLNASSIWRGHREHRNGPSILAAIGSGISAFQPRPSRLQHALLGRMGRCARKTHRNSVFYSNLLLLLARRQPCYRLATITRLSSAPVRQGQCRV